MVRVLAIGFVLALSVTAGCSAAAVGEAWPGLGAVPPAGAGLSLEPSALPTAAELAGRARRLTDYALEHRVGISGVYVAGRAYVSGRRMRQELHLGGQDTVILVDLRENLAYTLDPDGQTATRVGLSQLTANGLTETPTGRVESLPPDALPIGVENMDGCEALVYDVTGVHGSVRLWIWAEHGVPLRIELPGPQARLTIEMFGYAFGPQPEELFELPAGIAVVDMGQAP